MARLRWVFTASTTRGTRIPIQSGKEDSFTCGNTKTGRGKSRGSSVTTTTPRPSNGHEPSEDLRGRQYVWGRASEDREKIHEQHQGDAASNADDGAGVVRVDGGGSGNFRKAGHQHHVAGDHDDEAGSGGQRGVGDVERPAGRSAETFRIVGEGVLRFGDADGQFSITPFREVPQLRFSLLAEIHVARAVNFLRDSPNFFRERLFQGVKGMHAWRGIFGDGIDDFFGEFFRAGAALRESFGESAGHSALRAVGGEPIQIGGGVIGKTVYPRGAWGNKTC